MNVFGPREAAFLARRARTTLCLPPEKSYGGRGWSYNDADFGSFFAAAVSVIVSVCFAKVIRFLQRPGVCIVYGAVLPRSSDFQPMMK